VSLIPILNVPLRGQVRKTSAQKSHLVFSAAAPTLGVDSRQALANSDTQTAIAIDNMFARSFGLEMRAGYTQYATLSPANPVTLMTYTNHTADAGTSRFFVAADDGKVYDITTPTPDNVTPTEVLEVPGQIRSGECYWLNFVTEAGNYLCVVFPGAGYYTYNSTAGWVQHAAGTAAGQIDGADPKNFGFIYLWKNRIFFVEENTSTAYYLPSQSLTGAVSPFDFGTMFPHGGEMAFGGTWTVDSGSGLNDMMVVISSEGDLLLYEGTDPNDISTFSLNGRWYVGHVPDGRRFATPYGADMALVSERGLLLMTDILRGTDTMPQNEAAARINQLLQPDVRASIHTRYWEIKMLTDVNILAINAPQLRLNTGYIWALDMTAFGASKMTNFPFSNMEMFEGQSYAADNAGRVWKLWQGSKDGYIGETTPGAGDEVFGKDIEAYVQTAFLPLGEPFRWKRFILVRAGFRSLAAPAARMALNPEWTFAQPLAAPTYVETGQSLWDEDDWNYGIWSGSTQTFKVWVGAQGMGHYASLALRVRGRPKTVFIDWDCVVEAGGIL
jgi:hypothetical protein